MIDDTIYVALTDGRDSYFLVGFWTEEPSDDDVEQAIEERHDGFMSRVSYEVKELSEIDSLV